MANNPLLPLDVDIFSNDTRVDQLNLIAPNSNGFKKKRRARNISASTAVNPLLYLYIYIYIYIYLSCIITVCLFAMTKFGVFYIFFYMYTHILKRIQNMYFVLCILYLGYSSQAQRCRKEEVCMSNHSFERYYYKHIVLHLYHNNK